MITPKEGADLALANGLEYFECSAVRVFPLLEDVIFYGLIRSWINTFQKEMQNVDQPFLHLAKAWCDLYREKMEVMKSLAA